MAENMKDYVLLADVMFKDSVEYRKGDVVALDAKRGDELTADGSVVAKADHDRLNDEDRSAADEHAKALREAEEAAADAEQRKVDAAHTARLEQSAVTARTSLEIVADDRKARAAKAEESKAEESKATPKARHEQSSSKG